LGGPAITQKSTPECAFSRSTILKNFPREALQECFPLASLWLPPSLQTIHRKNLGQRIFISSGEICINFLSGLLSNAFFQPRNVS